MSADANFGVKSRAVTDGEMILATVDVPVPPERVFRALTTDEAETWWGSDDFYHVRDWKADLRVGGHWSLSVHTPDGNIFPASGEFLEIDSPGKIALTRRYDWDNPRLGRRVTTVTYRMDPIPNGTHVTVRHEGFAGCRESAYEHETGWTHFLDWLQAYLETGARTNLTRIFKGDRS